MRTIVYLTLCCCWAWCVVSGVSSNAVNECPAGFTWLSSVNGCYQVTSSRHDWDVSQLTCRQLHPSAHLAVISNQQQNEAIGSLAAALDENVREECGLDAWLGLWTAGQRSDRISQSEFVWKPEGDMEDTRGWQLMTYTNWADREPNFRGKSESCLMLITNTYERDQWRAHSCHTRFCALCQLDLV